MKKLFASRGAAAASASLLTLLVAGGGYAIAAGGSTIHACAKKSNGALRTANRCKKSERGLSWNTQGPRGPSGVPGAQGSRGPQGPQGPQGVAGTPATKLFATVQGGGTIDASSPGVHIYRFSAGVYELNMGQDISHCAAVATLGAVPIYSSSGTSTGRAQGYILADTASAGSTLPGSGFPSGNTVTVEEYSGSSDALTESSFNLAVVC